MSSAAGSAPPQAVGRAAAAADILLTVLVTGLLYAVELGLQRAAVLPASGLYTGAITLVGTFLFVWWLVRRRGEGLPALGLWRPPTWWFVPAWGIAVLVVNLAAQAGVVAPLVAAHAGLDLILMVQAYLGMFG